MTNRQTFQAMQASAAINRRRVLAGFAGALVLAMAFVALWFAAPQAAFADNAKMDAPVTVSDDITRLHVNKLDADTHEYVKGATMAVIDEETGKVVDSWVTDGSTHEIEKLLDAGKTYILRELAAPDGFDKIADVRFEVKKTEGEGIEILSGSDDVELSDSYKLAVYDKRQPTEKETTVTKTRPGTETNTKSPENTSKVVAPKTGDETPLTLVAGLMGLGVSLILILQLVKRRIEE